MKFKLNLSRLHPAFLCNIHSTPKKSKKSSHVRKTEKPLQTSCASPSNIQLSEKKSKHHKKHSKKHNKKHTKKVEEEEAIVTASIILSPNSISKLKNGSPAKKRQSIGISPCKKLNFDDSPKIENDLETSTMSVEELAEKMINQPEEKTIIADEKSLVIEKDNSLKSTIEKDQNLEIEKNNSLETTIEKDNSLEIEKDNLEFPIEKDNCPQVPVEENELNIPTPPPLPTSFTSIQSEELKQENIEHHRIVLENINRMIKDKRNSLAEQHSTWLELIRQSRESNAWSFHTQKDELEKELSLLENVGLVRCLIYYFEEIRSNRVE